MAAQTGAEPRAPNRATIDCPLIAKDDIKPLAQRDQSAHPQCRERSRMRQFIHNLLAGLAVWSI